MCWGNRPDVFSSDVRRSRRERYCHECRATIAKGDRYAHESSLYDGSWSTWDACLDCVELARLVMRLDHCTTWNVGDLASTVVELSMLGDLPPEQAGRVAGLHFAGRESQCDALERRKQEWAQRARALRVVINEQGVES